MLEHKMDYKVSDRSVSARSALLFVAKVAARLVLRGVSCLSSQLLTQSAVRLQCEHRHISHSGRKNQTRIFTVILRMSSGVKCNHGSHFIIF